MTSLLRGGSLPLSMQPPPLPVDKRSLERVVHLLSVAKKPILYVGQGANDAPAELIALAEAAQIPFTTTVHAMGVLSEAWALARASSRVLDWCIAAPAVRAARISRGGAICVWFIYFLLSNSSALRSTVTASLRCVFKEIA